VSWKLKCNYPKIPMTSFCNSMYVQRAYNIGRVV
jgi:hypothetical protein